jgi:hypothetical protein
LSAGEVETLHFARTDEPGKYDAWYVPLMLMPVKVERSQKGGDTITMELVRLY